MARVVRSSRMALSSSSLSMSLSSSTVGGGRGTASACACRPGGGGRGARIHKMLSILLPEAASKEALFAALVSTPSCPPFVHEAPTSESELVVLLPLSLQEGKMVSEGRAAATSRKENKTAGKTKAAKESPEEAVVEKEPARPGQLV
jgi:hypothetical protein